MTDRTIRNEYDEVVMTSHAPKKMEGAALAGAATPTQLADLYVSQNKAELGLTESRMEGEIAPGLGIAPGEAVDEYLAVLPFADAQAGSPVVMGRTPGPVPPSVSLPGLTPAALQSPDDLHEWRGHRVQLRGRS